MNKKGFTMVELLTTIVILGVISVIGIVAVTKVINSAKNNHYNTVLKNMKVAAESYFSDNRNNLPKVVGQNNTVTIKSLVDSKYLDSIKDNNGKVCNYDESVVTVYKTAISSYKYVSTLKCDNYDNSKEAINGDLKIDISLTKPYNDKTDQATISSSDGVRSYHYKIFKNGVLLYDSGVIDQGIRDKVTIGLDYKDQANNGTNIRVVVSATDIYGNTKQASSSVIVENKNAPLCGTSIKGSSTSWIKDNRTISINCKDNNDIKCKQARYSKTFDSTIKEGYITIEGDNEVNTDCKVNVYVDKTIPTCSISGNPTGWVDSNQTLTVTGKDSDSGVSSYSWTSGDSGFSSTKTKTTSGNNTYTTWIKDGVGNVGSCNTVVDKIDTENPTCTISANPTGQTQGNVTLTVSGSDSQSGVRDYSWSSGDSGFPASQSTAVGANKTYTAWVRDNVGRIGSCQYSVSNIFTDGWKSENGCSVYYQGGNKLTGLKKVGSSWYYFDGSGCRKTGWIKDTSSTTGGSCKSGWWYFNNDGKMYTGWLIQYNAIGRKQWFYLAKGEGKGDNKEGKWEGAQALGCMYTGWVYSEDYSCNTHGWYLTPTPTGSYESGEMLRSQFVNNSYVKDDGCWVNKTKKDCREGTNIRSSASLNASVVGGLGNKEIFYIIDESNSEFYYGYSNNKRTFGYVKKSCLNDTGDFCGNNTTDCRN